MEQTNNLVPLLAPTLGASYFVNPAAAQEAAEKICPYNLFSHLFTNQSCPNDDDCDFYRINDFKIDISNNFNKVSKSCLAFFAHVNRVTQLGISYAQEHLLNISAKWSNITHTGIVSGKFNDQTIALHEIPNGFDPISNISYNVSELPAKEEMLFFDVSLLVPEEEREELNRLIDQVSSTFVNGASKFPINQTHYNFHGLFGIFFKNKKFQRSDWKDLLDSLMEYHLLTDSKDTHLPKHFLYFCSEFVLKKIQIARLIQKFPEVNIQVKNACENFDPKHRIAIIEKLYRQLQESGLFIKIAQDPLFFSSSGATAPGDLLVLAEKHRLPILRVENSKPAQLFSNPTHFFLDLEALVVRIAKKYLDDAPIRDQSSLLCDMPDEMEEHLYRLAKQFGNSTDASLQCLVEYLSSKDPFRLGFSQETVTCLLHKCASIPADKIESCVGDCIKNTFTVFEKLKLALFSIEISRAIDRLIANHKLKDFLDLIFSCEKMQNLKIKDLEKVLDFLFPPEVCGWSPLCHLENYLLKNKVMKREFSVEEICKFLPLAIAGMKDIYEALPGLKYESPIARIQKFALTNGYTLSKQRFAMCFAALLKRVKPSKTRI